MSQVPRVKLGAVVYLKMSWNVLHIPTALKLINMFSLLEEILERQSRGHYSPITP